MSNEHIRSVVLGNIAGVPCTIVLVVGNSVGNRVGNFVASDPVAEDPVAEDPAAEDPVAEDPVAEDPVASTSLTIAFTVVRRREMLEPMVFVTLSE